MSQQDIGWGVPSSAYVHIPFCRRRCFYCDFPVFVVGDRSRGENSGTIAEYVEVLCQEIRIAPVYGQPLETIFFWWWYSFAVINRTVTTYINNFRKTIGNDL